MKKVLIISLLIMSLLILIGCVSRKIEKAESRQVQSIEQVDSKGALQFGKSFTDSAHLDYFNLKSLNLTVIPFSKSETDQPRPVKVVDNRGNSIEMVLNPNDELKFGTADSTKIEIAALKLANYNLTKENETLTNKYNAINESYELITSTRYVPWWLWVVVYLLGMVIGWIAHTKWKRLRIL